MERRVAFSLETDFEFLIMFILLHFAVVSHGSNPCPHIWGFGSDAFALPRTVKEPNNAFDPTPSRFMHFNSACGAISVGVTRSAVKKITVPECGFGASGTNTARRPLASCSSSKPICQESS